MALNAFDLGKLGRLLKNDSRYAADVRVMEEFTSACSILRDLLTVMDSISAILDIQFDDQFREKFGQALMMHAVITYSRALVARTDNRRTINVPNLAFTSEQRVKHAAMSDLRSTALAHYHKPVGRYATEWIDDRAIVIVRGDQIDSPKDVFKRYNWKKEALEDLLDLTQTAIVYVSAEKTRRSDAARDVLIKRTQDTFFQAKLHECVFDPESFFTSTDTISAFWDDVAYMAERHIQRP